MPEGMGTEAPWRTLNGGPGFKVHATHRNSSYTKRSENSNRSAPGNDKHPLSLVTTRIRAVEAPVPLAVQGRKGPHQPEKGILTQLAKKSLMLVIEDEFGVTRTLKVVSSLATGCSLSVSAFLWVQTSWHHKVSNICIMSYGFLGFFIALFLGNLEP